MTFARFPIGGYPGDSGGWDAQRQWIEAQRARMQTPTTPAMPAAPTWAPDYLNTPRTPYPANPYAPAADPSVVIHKKANRRGFGGGMGYSGPVISVDPEMTLGPGSYWPGHSAERYAQNQSAILGILAGRVQADTSNPAQLAAAMAAGRRNPNPFARAAAGGSYAGGGGLASGYQSAYDAAQQANEARYGDILSGYEARRAANRGAGAQEAADINTAWGREAARRRQEMIGRGLGNSTVLQNGLQGAERERLADQGRLNERLRREESNLLADELGFMERRTDEGPDMNQAIALAQGLGQSGYGQPQVIGTQVVPTMGGVGYFPSGGYSMPVMGGFVGANQVNRGPSAQQVRAAHALANRGHAGAQAWLRQLQRRMSA